MEMRGSGGGPAPLEDESAVLGSGPAAAVLPQFLGFVRDQLGADTATVLLLDVGASALESVAAVGQTESVKRRYRVPIGRGFAGAIAQQRQPASVTDVGPGTVLNPHILDHGVHSLLGVPMLHEGRLMGVLHVGSLRRREFTDEDVALLVRSAARVAHAVATLSKNTDDSLAAALQRTLIPATPPAVSGLDLAARYVPAEGRLGGDWHDVFSLPSGKVGLVIGDIMGHGLDAAIVMGRLRSALRAYALEHEDPARVLELMDAKIHAFEVGVMATVLYVVTEPPFVRMSASSAGHLAPLLAVSGSDTAQVELEPDPPLGVDASTPRRTHEITLPTSASVCLFTDGLVERRHDLEAAPAGQLEAGLNDLLGAFTYEAADAACTHVLDTAVSAMPFVHDDMAMLIARPVTSVV